MNPKSIKTIEFGYSTYISKKLVSNNAPKEAKCAILHGAFWGWSKSKKIDYFDEDIDVDIPRFASEPTKKYLLFKRRKYSLI